MFKKIIKRDGSEVSFDEKKISAAIFKAGRATGEFGATEAGDLTDQVIEYLKSALKKKELQHTLFPHVEEIQNVVERVLMKSRYKQTAKAYILYREQHAEMRLFAMAASLDLVDNYLDKLVKISIRWIVLISLCKYSARIPFSFK